MANEKRDTRHQPECKLQLIPFICASELTPELEEHCLEKDYPLHGDSGVIEVDLGGGDPFAAWLEQQGYRFSQTEIDRGWGHIALLGT